MPEMHMSTKAFLSILVRTQMATRRTFTSCVFHLPRWRYSKSSGPFRYPLQAFLPGGPFTHLRICWLYRCRPKKKSTVVKRSGHRPLTIIISSFEIEMFHMSDGSRYSNCDVMGFNYGSLMRFRMIRLQLTDCRISAKVYPRIMPGSCARDPHDLFVWDWRTGKKYLVSHRFPARNEPASCIG